MKKILLLLIATLSFSSFSFSMEQTSEKQNDEKIEKKNEINENSTIKEVLSKLWEKVKTKASPYFDEEEFYAAVLEYLLEEKSDVYAFKNILNFKELEKLEVLKDLDIKEQELNELKEIIFPAKKEKSEKKQKTIKNSDNFMQSKLLEIQSKLSSKFSSETIYKMKGAIIGAGMITIPWILSHSVCHSCMEFFEPQGFNAAILASGAGFCLWKLYNYLNKLKPKNVNNLILIELAKKLQDTQNGKQDNKPDAKKPSEKENKESKKNSFDKFLDTLTEKQLMLLVEDPKILENSKKDPKILQNHIMQTIKKAKKDPTVFLGYNKFIDSLSIEQSELLHKFFKK